MPSETHRLPLLARFSRKTSFHDPITHGIVLASFLAEGVLACFASLSSAFITKSFKAPITIKELLRFSTHTLLCFLYLLSESGETVLSIIEPAHSIQAAWFFIVSIFFWTPDTRYVRITQRLRCIFTETSPQAMKTLIIIKLFKIIILLTSATMPLYQSYMGLRLTMMHLWMYRSPKNRSDRFKPFSILLILFVISRKGKAHIFLAILWTSTEFLRSFLSLLSEKLPLYNTNLQSLEDSFHDLPPSSRSTLRSFILDKLRISLNRLEVFRRHVRDSYPLLFELFDDTKTAPMLTDNGEKGGHFYAIMHIHTTETQITSRLSTLLSRKLGHILPFHDHVIEKDPMFCEEPIAFFSIYQLYCLSFGVRLLPLPRHQRSSPGYIYGLSRYYSDPYERFRTMVSYVLRYNRGTAVSYRHEPTLEQSCSKIETLISSVDIRVLWADVFTGEVKRVEALEVEWLEVGLDPYMYFNVLREGGMQDGEERLWIYLEKRLRKRAEFPLDDLNVYTTSFQGNPNLLHYLLYITGKVLMLEAYYDRDVVDAAVLGDNVYKNILTGASTAYGILRSFAIIDANVKYENGYLVHEEQVDKRKLNHMEKIANMLSQEDDAIFVVYPVVDDPQNFSLSYDDDDNGDMSGTESGSYEDDRSVNTDNSQHDSETAGNTEGNISEDDEDNRVYVLTSPECIRVRSAFLDMRYFAVDSIPTQEVEENQNADKFTVITPNVLNKEEIWKESIALEMSYQFHEED